MSRKQQEPARLKAARYRFRKWRRHREGHSRIPHSLWKLATELGVEYGVSPTSRALGVSYSDLKKRVSGEQKGKGAIRESSFVEVPFRGSNILHCSMELENSRGSRLKVELSGQEFPDISELAQILYRERV